MVNVARPRNKLISESAVAKEQAMATTRKQYTSRFKARVAIEAIRGEKTLNHRTRSGYFDH